MQREEREAPGEAVRVSFAKTFLLLAQLIDVVRSCTLACRMRMLGGWGDDDVEQAIESASAKNAACRLQGSVAFATFLHRPLRYFLPGGAEAAESVGQVFTAQRLKRVPELAIVVSQLPNQRSV